MAFRSDYETRGGEKVDRGYCTAPHPNPVILSGQGGEAAASTRLAGRVRIGASTGPGWKSFARLDLCGECDERRSDGLGEVHGFDHVDALLSVLDLCDVRLSLSQTLGKAALRQPSGNPVLLEELGDDVVLDAAVGLQQYASERCRQAAILE